MVNRWNLPRGCSGTNWREKKLRPLAMEAINAVLPQPTAPYHEQLPAKAVREWCRKRKWKLQEDAWGNLVVRVPGKKRGRPGIAFEAAFAASVDALADIKYYIKLYFFRIYPIVEY